MEDSKIHQIFRQTKKKIRHLTIFARKKGLVSRTIELSYAETTTPPTPLASPPIN
jgi:hypothetical protein